MTIGQVLNTVQGMANSSSSPVPKYSSNLNKVGLVDQTQSESSIHNHEDHLEQEQIPSRQHNSNDKQ